MSCDYYRILYHNVVLADHMTLETALILLKGLFEKFWQETDSYTIEKMETEGATF